MDFLKDIATPVTMLGEAWRLIVTIISLLIMSYVLYKNRNDAARKITIESLNATVDAKNQELEAVKSNCTRIENECQKLTVECIALRNKTDISQIVDLITAATKNNSTIVDAMMHLLNSIYSELKENKRAISGLFDLVRQIDKTDTKARLRKNK